MALPGQCTWSNPLWAASCLLCCCFLVLGGQVLDDRAKQKAFKNICVPLNSDRNSTYVPQTCLAQSAIQKYVLHSLLHEYGVWMTDQFWCSDQSLIPHMSPGKTSLWKKLGQVEFDFRYYRQVPLAAKLIQMTRFRSLIFNTLLGVTPVLILLKIFINLKVLQSVFL